MRTIDLIGSAVSNTFRSKTRTILTILAIFVGAFTLTLTSGLGTGINAYIDDTVTSIGASDVMTVTKTPETATGVAADGPVEYDPDAVASGQPGPPGSDRRRAHPHRPRHSGRHRRRDSTSCRRARSLPTSSRQATAPST